MACNIKPLVSQIRKAGRVRAVDAVWRFRLNRGSVCHHVARLDTRSLPGRSSARIVIVETEETDREMGIEGIGAIGFMGTLLLVIVGLLNFSVFRKLLRIAKDQIDTAVRQLESAQKQPHLYLIQRAVTETSNHLLLFVQHPKLRPYFYSAAEWKPGDEVPLDEVRAMAELILNNFASALMHSAAFPEYPVRGVDRIIMSHLRRSPALREFLLDNFERFTFTGLTLLCLKNDTREQVEADLQRLIAATDVDARETERRRELLQLYRNSEVREPIEFTSYSMKRRR